MTTGSDPAKAVHTAMRTVAEERGTGLSIPRHTHACGDLLNALAEAGWSLVRVAPAVSPGVDADDRPISRDGMEEIAAGALRVALGHRGTTTMTYGEADAIAGEIVAALADAHALVPDYSPVPGVDAEGTVEGTTECRRPSGGHIWEKVPGSDWGVYRCKRCGVKHTGDLQSAPMAPLDDCNCGGALPTCGPGASCVGAASRSVSTGGDEGAELTAEQATFAAIEWQSTPEARRQVERLGGLLAKSAKSGWFGHPGQGGYWEAVARAALSLVPRIPPVPSTGGEGQALAKPIPDASQED